MEWKYQKEIDGLESNNPFMGEFMPRIRDFESSDESRRSLTTSLVALGMKVQWKSTTILIVVGIWAVYGFWSGGNPTAGFLAGFCVLIVLLGNVKLAWGWVHSDLVQAAIDRAEMKRNKD